MNSVVASGETGSGSFQKKKFGKNLNKLTKPPDSKDNRRAPTGRSHGGLHLLGSSNKRSSTLLSKLAAPRPLNTPSLRSENDREHTAGVQLTAVTSQGSVWATQTACSGNNNNNNGAKPSSSLGGGGAAESTNHHRGGGGVNLKAAVEAPKLASSSTSLRNPVPLNHATATATAAVRSSATSSSTAGSNPAVKKWRDGSSQNNEEAAPEAAAVPSNDRIAHPVPVPTEEDSNNMRMDSEKRSSTPSDDDAAAAAMHDVPRNSNLPAAAPAVECQDPPQSAQKNENQMQIMAKLAKQKAHAKRLEEEQRQREQRERADVRLKELESKLQLDPVVPCQIHVGNSAPAKLDGRRQLFEPSTMTQHPHVSSSGSIAKDAVESSPSTQQPVQLIHLANYEDRSRRTTNSNSTSNNDKNNVRMLFDPKSGSLVDASKVTTTTSSNNNKHLYDTAGNGGNKRDRRRTKQHDEYDAHNSTSTGGNNNRRGGGHAHNNNNKSSKAAPPRTANSNSTNHKSSKNHHHSSNKRALPRTQGVLYKYISKDKNSAHSSMSMSIQCADGCDADMGYGAHTVPGGRVRNNNVKNHTNVNANLQQQQQQQPSRRRAGLNGNLNGNFTGAASKSNGNHVNGNANLQHRNNNKGSATFRIPPSTSTASSSSLLESLPSESVLESTMSASMSMPAYHASSMSKNIVKLSVNDTPESPTLQASAAPWQPQPPSTNINTSTSKSIVSIGKIHGNINELNGNDNGIDNSPLINELDTGLGFDPTSNTTSLISTSPDFCPTNNIDVSTDIDIDIDLVEEDVDAHFAILGSPSRLLGLASSSSQQMHARVTSSSLLGMSMGLNWDILGDASSSSGGVGVGNKDVLLGSSSLVLGSTSSSSVAVAAQSQVSSKPWESGAFGGFDGGSLLGQFDSVLGVDIDIHPAVDSQQQQQHKPS